jgi:hypothetical protein
MLLKEILLMNPKSYSSVCAWIVPLFVVFYSGCVDIPSEGHTPPDQNSSVRILYLDPTLATATITAAPGPDFTSFSDISTGAYGTASTYLTIPAGGKKLLVKGVDSDTSVITFGVDQRGTMFLLPRPAVSMPRFSFAIERFTFASTGRADTTLVKFMNTVARGSSDTVDVQLDILQFETIDTNVVTGNAVNNLSFGAFSSFVAVPAGSTVSFYATTSDSTTVLSDTISIIGASNRQFTVVAHDTIDAANGKVRFTSFEDN